MNPNPSTLTEAAEPLIHQLATELDQLKRQHRATVEAYEAALEELKASNEELQAINEELRSATEYYCVRLNRQF